MNFPIGYGINPQPPQQAKTEEPERLASARKRTRVKGGRFAADDPVGGKLK
jgi:hypothetical protein